MKFDFDDTLKRDAIDLSFSIKGDDKERDIYTEKATVKWALRLDVRNWGLDSFQYELKEMKMPITIDEIDENGKTETTNVCAEVKFSTSKAHKGFVCRIYEDVLENEEWKEEEYAIFPIAVNVEESAETSEGVRAQVYVKYIELDLESEQRKLTLSI